MNALDYELNRVRQRYEYALGRLREYAARDGDYKEIIRRLLTTRCFHDAAGSLNKHGYDNQFGCDGPLSRMEFLNFFIGHELLDDGDPGVGWHKYNLDTGEHEMCDPPKCLKPGFHRYDASDPNWNAKPFWHCCHEILPPGSKHLYEDEVLWVLDWHEVYEQERYDAYCKGDMAWSRKPEDPMMIALADEILLCDNE
jgi:hypothetical protein